VFYQSEERNSSSLFLLLGIFFVIDALDATIPNSVTSIGNSAFQACSNLASVMIPDSVTSIGKRVFMESGLTSVTIPGSVTSIDKDVFYLCSLTEVTYKGTKAQWEAFNVNKESITIHCSDGDI